MIGQAIERALTLTNDTHRLDRLAQALTRWRLAIEAKQRALSVEKAAGLGPSVRSHHPPWANEEVGSCDVPGMLTSEECRYYLWVGRLYSGQGEVVELGPWLGKSTHFICRGLADNEQFMGHKVHVFDDFVWRSSWMDQYVPEPERPANHGDFFPLYQRYIDPVAHAVVTLKRKIADYDGNESLPMIEWGGAPVEMMYIDCGRTFEANEGWWRIFQPSFIPGKTLLILQDWGTHREVPVRWYNQMKTFTDSKGEALRLVHELAEGGIATFLYG